MFFQFLLQPHQFRLLLCQCRLGLRQFSLLFLQRRLNRIHRGRFYFLLRRPLDRLQLRHLRRQSIPQNVRQRLSIPTQLRTFRRIKFRFRLYCRL